MKVVVSVASRPMLSYRNRTMGRPPKDNALTEKVEARISSEEKAALAQLLGRRGRELANLGIAGGDTFASWLRSIIRREAAEAGFPIEDAAEKPAPKVPAKRVRSSKR